MSERERWAPLSLTLAGIPLRGVSIAGRETWFHVPSLDLAFDVGRAPAEVVPAPNVFLSHAHLDHASGLAWWVSQRRLARLPGGVVRTEPSTVAAWREILAATGIPPAETAYVGDDIVDLPLLRAVGFSAAPSDAEPYVLDAVQFVASRPGGHGAVREIIEFLLRSRGSWDAVTAKYFSAGETR